jgi:hypothetical protein
LWPTTTSAEARARAANSRKITVSIKGSSCSAS